MSDEELLEQRREIILNTLRKITGKDNPNQMAPVLKVTDWAIHKWLRAGYVPMARVLKLYEKYPHKFQKKDLNYNFE